MKIYLLVGCPGSGKTWVANQLKAKMNYIPHDNFIKTNQTYLSNIIAQAKGSKDQKAILIETPFSVNQIKGPLEQHGLSVETVYIQENESTLRDRYHTREQKPIPQGHLTRQETYKERAKESGSFFGSSQQCLDYLNNKSEGQGVEP